MNYRTAIVSILSSLILVLPVTAAYVTGVAADPGISPSASLTRSSGVYEVSRPPWPLNTQSGIGWLIHPIHSTGSQNFVIHNSGGYTDHTPSNAVVTFTFTAPTVVSGIAIIQHANGVSRVEGRVGDDPDALVSVGDVFSPKGDVTGSSRFFEGESSIFDFGNELAGSLFQVRISKTSTASGYALYRIYPLDADGQRIHAGHAGTNLPVVDLAELQGTGTPSDPYLLTTPAELDAMRQDLTAHYALGNDIDLSSTAFWHYGSGWEPVGTPATSFTGSFDGRGHTIEGLRINRPELSRVGLFGNLNGATVRDVVLSGVSVSGGQYTGALVGNAGLSDFALVTVSGEIASVSPQVGGVAGAVGSCDLNRISFHGNIVGSAETGGLVGLLESSSLSASFSMGSVRGGTYVGGMAGRVRYAASVVTDCFSLAGVVGVDRVGGLVGGIDSSAAIIRSYAAGEIEGTSSVGGLVGIRGSGASASFSYWDLDVSEFLSSAAGEGRTTAELREVATFATWDFSSVWIVDDDDRNEGYPYLQEWEPAFFITAIVEPASGGFVDGEGLYHRESPLQLSATPHTGYEFVGWQLGEVSIAETETLFWRANRDWDLTALFQLNTYAITASASPDGGGSVAGADTYAHFSTASLLATPATGYHFVEWTEGGATVSSDASYSFEVSGPRELVAVFALNTYAISASASPDGGGSVAGADTYAHFSTASLLATPATGYHFVVWTEGGATVSSDPSYSFEVSGPRDLVAVFALNTYAITASASPDGGGSVAGADTYAHFSTASLLATPATGYHFVEWTEGGATVSSDASYRFEVSGMRDLGICPNFDLLDMPCGFG